MKKNLIKIVMPIALSTSIVAPFATSCSQVKHVSDIEVDEFTPINGKTYTYFVTIDGEFDKKDIKVELVSDLSSNFAISFDINGNLLTIRMKCINRSINTIKAKSSFKITTPKWSDSTNEFIMNVEGYNGPEMNDEFYDIIKRDTGNWTIKGLSEKIKENPELLNSYDSLVFKSPEDGSQLSFGGTYTFDMGLVKQIKKVLFNNTSATEFCIGNYAFSDKIFEIIDFGVGLVEIWNNSFQSFKQEPTIKKVVLSPNVYTNSSSAVATEPAFIRQTNISTIDVSSFTTHEDIEKVDNGAWQQYGSYKIWQDDCRAAKGKIIISDSSLADHWYYTFNNNGLTVDGTNWVFEVAK